MSLTPIGDKGQRYEVSSAGYPFEGQTCVAGWTESKVDAERMASGLRRAPGCVSVTIRDRWGKEPPFTYWAGVLR